jgi:Protein of unknown function DUF262
MNEAGPEVEVAQVLEEIGSDGMAAGLEAEALSDERGEIKAPFDPAQIDVATQMRTIDLLLTRLREGEMNLSPDFQRRANLWTIERKSSLIESVLLRIPIPSLYVSEDTSGNYTVVDGLQRMCAIAHFVDVDALNKAVGTKLDPLRLAGLQALSNEEYGDCSFNDLPRALRRRINETELTLHVIRASTPSAVKFNIFSRINRGGLPLSSQEIRNAIYPGVWREDARELSHCKEFLDASERKVKGERMEDAELILRFLAHFHLAVGEKRPSDQNLDDFLNGYAQASNSFSEAERERAREAFRKAMRYAGKVFGRHAFRKYFIAGDTRKPINRGLFEAQAVVLSRFSEDALHALSHNQPLVLQKFADLMNLDSEFISSVLYATGRGSSSNIRIEKLSGMLREVLGA